MNESVLEIVLFCVCVNCRLFPYSDSRSGTEIKNPTADDLALSTQVRSIFSRLE